ncbi:capsule assembly Wzi family protein [Larkinella punicea]|nr:capsule assembly Wzi family protein [Larkinella punicea]
MVSSARQTPFWLRANQFGSVPFVAPATLARLGSTGTFRRDSVGKGWGAGYGVEAVAFAGPNSRILLPEAYAKVSYRSIELVVGRRKEKMGLVDTTLSSGSYSWSGNALPITKIQIGTNGFTPLKFTRGVIAINAFFAHGWFPTTDSIRNSFLHQKALYGRIGKPNWKVKFYGGILHNAQWGGHSDYLSDWHAIDGKLPSSFKDYLHIILSKQPGQNEELSNHDLVNQFGNHLGSIDLGIEISLGRWQVMGYHQHPFEDKSGVAFINVPDGLYGIRFITQPVKTNGFQLHHILFEYLNTMDQSGATVETGTRYDGQDDYFNNYQYLDGWVNNRHVIGTPFLSRRADILPERRNDFPNKRIWSIANNRVQMGHLGLAGMVGQGIQWQTRLSISQNYGTHRYPFAKSVSQFSGAAWLTWPLSWLGGSELRTAIALDQGQLYSNAFGGWISIRKVWKAVK